VISDTYCELLETFYAIPHLYHTAHGLVFFKRQVLASNALLHYLLPE